MMTQARTEMAFSRSVCEEAITLDCLEPIRYQLPVFKNGFLTSLASSFSSRELIFFLQQFYSITLKQIKRFGLYRIIKVNRNNNSTNSTSSTSIMFVEFSMKDKKRVSRENEHQPACFIGLTLTSSTSFWLFH